MLAQYHNKIYLEWKIFLKLFPGMVQSQKWNPLSSLYLNGLHNSMKDWVRVICAQYPESAV